MLLKLLGTCKMRKRCRLNSQIKSTSNYIYIFTVFTSPAKSLYSMHVLYLAREFLSFCASIQYWQPTFENTHILPSFQPINVTVSTSISAGTF